MRYSIPVALITLVISSADVAAQAAAHVMVAPDELKWVAVSALPPGAQMAVIEGPLNEAVPFTVRLRLPANYQIPAHWHPAIEHVTVLSGTFNVGLGNTLERSKTHRMSAGSVGIIPPRTNHFGWTAGETTLQLHGVGPWAVHYVNPADDPRNK